MLKLQNQAVVNLVDQYKNPVLLANPFYQLGLRFSAPLEHEA